LQELTSGLGLPVITTTLTGPVAELPSEARALAYFFCAECLTNVVHHARASSATLTVDCSDGLMIEVGDNGRGGASLAAGRGLQGLADRVRAAGGSIQIDSPVGGPTKIRATIPRLP
jgi:signal transduction histidine kinase